MKEYFEEIYSSPKQLVPPGSKHDINHHNVVWMKIWRLQMAHTWKPMVLCLKAAKVVNSSDSTLIFSTYFPSEDGFMYTDFT